MTNQSIALSDALGFYTQTNASMLNVISAVAQNAGSPEIKQKSLAYYNFVQGKERAGIERAVLSNAFTQDSFNLDSYSKFLELVLLQDTYFKEFELITTPELISVFEQAKNDSAFRQVNRYRDIAKSKNLAGGFGVNASQWFESATSRINTLKSIEDNIAGALIELAESQQSSAQASYLIYLLLTVIVLGACIALGYFIVKGINKQVGVLTSTLHYCADNKALDRLLPVEGKDEFSEISTALNSVIENFRMTIDSISRSSENLAASAEQNSVTVGQTSTALNSQKEQTYLVATAIEEMSQTINEVSNNTAEAATAGIRS